MKNSFRSRLSLFTLRLRLTARMARALALLLIFVTTFAVMLPAQQADSLKLGAQAVPGDTGR